MPPLAQDDLGVNAVLLDPVAAHLTASDFLGTLPASFVAPHPGFGTPRELKELVRDLHLLGKELFVSVHLAATAEGTDANPRALSFRGETASPLQLVSTRQLALSRQLVAHRQLAASRQVALSRQLVVHRQLADPVTGACAVPFARSSYGRSLPK